MHELIIYILSLVKLFYFRLFNESVNLFEVCIKYDSCKETE